MNLSRKLGLLRRLLEQSAEITVEDYSDPQFKTWKNAVERTLIRIFGSDSTEVEQFLRLKFHYDYYIAHVVDLSHKHKEIFRHDFEISTSAIKSYIEELEEDTDEGDGYGNSVAPNEMKKVFISHSSKDAHYVEEVIECLEAIGLTTEQIFCTSFESYGIGLGDNFLEAIKEELGNDTLVLFVLTRNFYASPVCLCEMGAAWMQSKRHIPILVPPFDFKDVEGVIPLTQGFRLNEPLKLNSFKEKLQSLFGLAAVQISVWERKRDRIILRIEEKIESDAAGAV